jgi:pseudouridylate synthase
MSIGHVRLVLMPAELIRVSPEVGKAIHDGHAVVALESTLITHGLPYPSNLEAARTSEAAVRAEGAVPATVAVDGGVIRVGLQEEELEQLAQVRDAAKVSTQTLAGALSSGGWGGTTVAATAIAAERAGIRVFATGGIGGVHRGGQDSLDISADLPALARAQVAVVCAGPKSILDVGRTLEVLETWGIPVVGWGTDELPGFFSRESGHRVPSRVDGAEAAAALMARQWALGLGGIVVCVPLPEEAALPREEVQAAIARAIGEAEAAGIHGPASTPFVLGRVAELTEGRSVRANLALIENDARVAARIAIAFAALAR